MATKLRDRVDVRLLRLRRQIAECHILDHASAKRAHPGHRGLLCSEGWVRQPHLLRQEASLQPASGSAPGDSSRTAVSRLSSMELPRILTDVGARGQGAKAP